MAIYENHSLLSYNELVQLVGAGVIDAPIENINGTSIDITLGPGFFIEEYNIEVIDLSKKQNITLNEVKSDYLILDPGEFCLATTAETFNLPDNISAEYKLKSSLARNGLQHMLAGWCDPGWSNSKLTLELKNVLQSQKLILREGMKIGQVVFWKSNYVPNDKSYSKTGQYNNQDTVTQSKGVR